MSIYEWESGKITLPAKDVAPLKKVLRERSNKFHADVRAKAVELHKAAKTTSVKKYGEFFEFNRYYLASSGDAVDTVARHILKDMWEKASMNNGTLHVPTVADVSKYAPKKTAKDNDFVVVGEHGYDAAYISFDDRMVRWTVEENNHALDNAYNAPMAKDFFTYLHKVEWTRGTGGYGVGNNEYNREDEYAGGGSNYMSFTYGPLGVEAAASHARMSKKDYMSKTPSLNEKTHAKNNAYERTLPSFRRSFGGRMW